MSYQNTPEPRYNELENSGSVPVEFEHLFGSISAGVVTITDITEVFDSIGATYTIPNRLWGSTTSQVEEFGIKII
jgi:hypothetical protein